jgi:hypothetical protein
VFSKIYGNCCQVYLHFQDFDDLKNFENVLIKINSVKTIQVINQITELELSVNDKIEIKSLFYNFNKIIEEKDCADSFLIENKKLSKNVETTSIDYKIDLNEYINKVVEAYNTKENSYLKNFSIYDSKTSIVDNDLESLSSEQKSALEEIDNKLYYKFYTSQYLLNYEFIPKEFNLKEVYVINKNKKNTYYIHNKEKIFKYNLSNCFYTNDKYIFDDHLKFFKYTGLLFELKNTLPVTLLNPLVAKNKKNFNLFFKNFNDQYYDSLSYFKKTKTSNIQISYIIENYNVLRLNVKVSQKFKNINFTYLYNVVYNKESIFPEKLSLNNYITLDNTKVYEITHSKEYYSSTIDFANIKNILELVQEKQNKRILKQYWLPDYFSTYKLDKDLIEALRFYDLHPN